ncbi:MAG TPA: cytochrome c peroxidase, partial [Polyangiaceae bacterium]|nr:cytochrome c peroxidase [Polyangiaceae bacterium]
KAAEIGGLPEYSAQFQKLFPDKGASVDTIAAAVASYERTLLCADTAFDRFVQGDDHALTSQQKQGWDLFKGKAMCNACHVPPFFSDAFLSDQGAFHNTGRGTVGKAEPQIDSGRIKVTQNPGDWAAFKTPSLRDITRSAPYFHDGSVPTLREAVVFMAKGGAKNRNLDVRLVDAKLSPAEISSLIAFLGSLECTGRLSPLAAH